MGRGGIPAAWKCRGVDAAQGGTPELASVSAPQSTSSKDTVAALVTQTRCGLLGT